MALTLTNLTGKLLRTIVAVGPFPLGLEVYCFIDHGETFRILTNTPFLGATEFKFDRSHRQCFALT